MARNLISRCTLPRPLLLRLRWLNIVQRDDGVSERSPGDVRVFYRYDLEAEDI